MKNGKVIVISLIILFIVIRGGIAFLTYKEKSLDTIIPMKQEQFDAIAYSQDYVDLSVEHANQSSTEDLEAVNELIHFLKSYTVKKKIQHKQHKVDRTLVATITIFHKHSKPVVLLIFDNYVLTSVDDWSYYSITNGPMDQEWIHRWAEKHFK